MESLLEPADSLYFKAWVGENYRNNPRERILILGESHYFAEGITPHPEFTSEVVREYLAGQHDAIYKFFTKLTHALTGVIPHDNRYDFWNAVAFANYLQDRDGKLSKARQEPQYEDMLKSYGPLFTLLDDVQPTAVIVLGNRLMYHLESIHRDGAGRYPFVYLPALRHNASILYRGYYQKENPVPFAFIKHPSSAFATSDWNVLLKQFVEKSMAA